MKTLITLAATLALCAAPFGSYANPQEADAQIEDGVVSGILSGVNALEGVVVMDGVSYQVPSSVADLSQFQAGDAVLLGYVRDLTGAPMLTFLRKEELG